MFFPRAWKETDRIREHGSALLVDEALAAGIRVFIQESFAPIYVDAGDRWITEEAPTRPVRYNQTTLKAEASAERFARAAAAESCCASRISMGPAIGSPRTSSDTVTGAGCRCWARRMRTSRRFITTMPHRRWWRR